jgi:hypothetical protein
MAVTAHTYTMLTKSLADKLANLETDSLKAMLLSAYTVGTTQDTAQFLADVLAVATEASGTGYTAGGQALTSVTLTKSGHVYTLTCANPSWTSSTITASYVVFYDSTPGSNATDPVICYWDFGGASSSSSGTFTLTVSGSGLVTFTGS